MASSGTWLTTRSPLLRIRCRSSGPSSGGSVCSRTAGPRSRSSLRRRWRRAARARQPRAALQGRIANAVAASVRRSRVGRCVRYRSPTESEASLSATSSAPPTKPTKTSASAIRIPAAPLDASRLQKPFAKRCKRQAFAGCISTTCAIPLAPTAQRRALRCGPCRSGWAIATRRRPRVDADDAPSEHEGTLVERAFGSSAREAGSRSAL
jgi:hypothetical protein